MWMSSPCECCQQAIIGGLQAWMQHLAAWHTIPTEWPSSRAQKLTGEAALRPYTTITESKKKRKYDTVPRPLNSFMIFAQHLRRNVLCEFSDASNSAISTQLGNLWRSVPKHLRTQYDEEACRLADIHKLEFPDYRYQPKKRGPDVVNGESENLPLRASKRAVKQRQFDDIDWSFTQRRTRHKSSQKGISKSKKTIKERKITRKSIKSTSSSQASQELVQLPNGVHCNDSAYSSCTSSATSSPSIPSPQRAQNISKYLHAQVGNRSLIYTSGSSNAFEYNMDSSQIYANNSSTPISIRTNNRNKNWHDKTIYCPNQNLYNEGNYKLHGFDNLGNPTQYNFTSYDEMQNYLRNQQAQSGRNYSGNSCGDSSLSTTAETSPLQFDENGYRNYQYDNKIGSGFYDTSFYSNTTTTSSCNDVLYNNNSFNNSNDFDHKNFLQNTMETLPMQSPIYAQESRRIGFGIKPLNLKYQPKSTAELLEAKFDYVEDFTHDAICLDDILLEIDYGQSSFAFDVQNDCLLSDLDLIDKDSLLPLC